MFNRVKATKPPARNSSSTPSTIDLRANEKSMSFLNIGLGLPEIAQEQAALVNNPVPGLNARKDLDISILLDSERHIPSGKFVRLQHYPDTGFVALAYDRPCAHGHRFDFGVCDYLE